VRVASVEAVAMAKKVVAKRLATTSARRVGKTAAAAKSPGRAAAKKADASAGRTDSQREGTEEELIAFLDRLLERGDQLKKEIEEVAARIRKGVPA
jgi:hypothetical protein